MVPKSTPSIRRSQKTGLPPGTLVHVGQRKVETPRMEIIRYDPSRVVDTVLEKPEQLIELRNVPEITWVNIIGLHDLALIETLGRTLNIHPLTLEDIVNTEQRPKIEDYDNYLYVVVKMLIPDKKVESIISEQVSFILSGNLLLTFLERSGDVFENVRKRIHNKESRLRERGVDYLLYSLLDAVVDSYFAILEDIGENIEELEDSILGAEPDGTTVRIQRLKRALLSVRRAVWPLREVVNALSREDIEEITAETRVFMRDIYDHTIQVLDTLESYRDMNAGLLDIYLTAVNNRMNAIMKMLTIIATIFIPLTFIVGVYGMNFHYMPELKWRWGYPMTWGIMVGIALGLLFYFRKKKWL